MEFREFNMRKLRLFISALIIASLVISLTGISSNTANALVPLSCDEGFSSTNGNFYYDQCDNICSPDSSTSIVVGDNSALPAATVSYLDGRKIKDLAEQNKDRYMYAQTKTGLPWQVVAAIHYREAGMSATQSIFNGAKLGTGINVDGQNVVSDPNEDALNAANHFIKMASGVYGIDLSVTPESITLEQWGNAYLAYNRGYLYKQAGKTYDQSPYVMNGFDASHVNMSWVGKPADPAVSGIDGNKAGALSVLVYLGGAKLSSDCSSSGAVSGDIVKTALNYTRDTPATDGMTDASLAKEAYRKAIVEFNGAPASYPQITDCGRFVSTVLHASKADESFPAVGVGSLIKYMNSSPKYQALGSIQMNELMPGDIMAIESHIIIYTGKNGDYVAADASYEQRVPSVRNSSSPTWMIANGASVWRLK